MDSSPQKFKWALLVVECMKQMRAEGFHFVDQEVLPNFNGTPDAMSVWFICEHHAAKERFDLQAATNALRKKLRDTDFPPHAIETLRTLVTSETEIAATGGRFHFFR